MMKTIRGILLIVSILIVSQQFSVAKSYPPGTKKVRTEKGILYIDHRILTNLDWAEGLCFLNSCELDKIGTDECNSCMCSAHDQRESVLDIDSVVWKSKYGNSKIIEVKYLPVVGMTISQAETYNLIRSKLVNYKYKKRQVRYVLLSENDYIELMNQKWKYLDLTSEYGELTAENSVFYQGRFIPIDKFDGYVTLRCKAIKSNI